MSETAIYKNEIAISRSNGNVFLRKSFRFLFNALSCLISLLLLPGVLFLMAVDCSLFVGKAVIKLIQRFPQDSRS